MNLCFVCNQYPPLRQGGHGSRTSVLARRLVQRGHKVTVVGVVPRNAGLTRATEEWVDDVRVFRLPPSSPWWRWRPGELWARWRLTSKLRALHRAAKFDLIDCVDTAGCLCFGAPDGVPLSVRFAGSVKLYANLGQMRDDPFITALEARTLAKGTHFYAPSRWAAQETLKVFGYADTKCEVIQNAVDVDVFAPAAADVTERGVVVFAGAIEPRKGIRELLCSMNIWGRSHPHSRLVVIGSGGDVRDNGKTLIERCLDELDPDLRARVEFTGHLDRTTRLLQRLQAAEVCVYPSHFETFGFAPVEAMAVGKPVVFTRAGSGPELVEDGISGVLCDTSDPKEIASCVQKILDNPDEGAQMGLQARIRVLERFNSRTWAEKCEAFFQQCIADNARHFQRIGKPSLRRFTS